MIGYRGYGERADGVARGGGASVARSVKGGDPGARAGAGQYPSFFQSSSLALSFTPALSRRFNSLSTSASVARPCR